ncbi:hypothetical protein KR009_000477, partial [Drosophila setifemur]
WLNLERDLLQNLQEYAEKLEEKIDIINDSVKEYKEEIAEANEDPELYLSNPINSFRLIRHMHQDWVSWQIYMEKPVAEEQVAKIESLLQGRHIKIEFQRAAEDVEILTKFYDLKPQELVAKDEGKSPLHLSPLDCYHLGLDRYETADYQGAAKWLGVAAKNFTLSKYSELYEMIGVPRWQMYRDYGRALRQLDRPEVYDAYQKANELSPHNVHLMEELRMFELLTLRDPMEPIPDEIETPTKMQEMCRGNFSPEPGHLFCEYITVNPFLDFAPLRIEVLVDELFAFLYLGSVYESEIEHLKDAFERCSPVDTFVLDEGITGCSISDGYSRVTRRLKERIQGMMVLDKGSDRSYIVQYASVKPFQVYKLFRNATKFPELNSEGFEEIEGTAMVFLNDESLGGGITISDYKMLTQPKKGNVLITFDEIAFETTICPNLEGSGL